MGFLKKIKKSSKVVKKVATSSPVIISKSLGVTQKVLSVTDKVAVAAGVEKDSKFLETTNVMAQAVDKNKKRADKIDSVINGKQKQTKSPGKTIVKGSSTAVKSSSSMFLIAGAVGLLFLLKR